MNYGLSTTSAPTNSGTSTTTTSQPKQNRASGSDTSATTETTFTPGRRARTFVPSARHHQGAHERSNRAANTSNRQATANRRSTSRPFQPAARNASSQQIAKEIDSAFAILNNQNFIGAEKAFRVILTDNWGELTAFEKQNTTVGLARSLKEQTREKQIEACSLLEELRLEGKLSWFGASTICNLDLTLSLCEEALGKQLEAETRLLKLRRVSHNADEKTLYKPSRYYPADINNARLWQSMGKNTQAERLLLNVKADLIERLHSEPSAAIAPKLQKYLDSVNMALVRLWEVMNKHESAEKLLLNMSRKHPNGSEEALCKPCGYRDIDLTLVRLWQMTGKNNRAEKLLLNMSGKRPGASEEELCKPCRKHEIDLTLVRHWELTGKNKLAEKLLLNMSGKHPDASEEILCKPCWQRKIDLTLVLHWAVKGKYSLAERLLLNMLLKHPDDSEDILCEPSGHHDIDLARARIWQDMDKTERAERLLLNISAKTLNDTEESLCKPSGYHDIDLALTRLWQIMGKHERAERLLLIMSGKQPGASEEILFQPCWKNDIDLTLVRHWEVMGRYKWSEKLLLNMSGKSSCASEQELCKPCGHNDIDLALVRLWEKLEKHELAEKLLLNMGGKCPNDSEENLCIPFGHHDIDLALVRLWEMMGKHEWAGKLLRRCCDLYHSHECGYTLLCFSAGQAEFMEMIGNHPETANTLLVSSIHYFNLACKQITNDDPESGNDSLEKALEIAESILEKYPLYAGAYSQKAHCLRMLGRSEQEWREWFEKAASLDPGRLYKEKTDLWRNNEATALLKLRSLKL
ncbi:hypothetical protein [Endozoicomonas sp. 8E]|uniref:hypothetical protein n=1 Tax=Endozoicomonas sp. 8E TaxID=3035692 RepID=UPI002939040D|nr:hypothetical protein [Endozoicomonas sp. 8E]WOG26238.1 hypothetical protein P6910_16930 [Endozoicomonas sp. 8E]